MKTNMLFLFAALLFASCSNNEPLKKNAEIWVETNIFPYLTKPSINHQLTQIIKIKNQGQCNDMTSAIQDSYTKGGIFTRFNDGLAAQDTNLIDLACRLKAIAQTQENALNYSPECKGISIQLQYGDKESLNYMVIYDKMGNILNSKIKKQYDENSKMNVYVTDK